jgi:hypothetical protein
MSNLHAIAVALLLVAGPTSAWAHDAKPRNARAHDASAHEDARLAKVDGELNRLCERLAKASGDSAAAIRRQMAALWHERVAALAASPRGRSAARSPASGISEHCLLLAKNAAASRSTTEEKNKEEKTIKETARKTGSGNRIFVSREIMEIHPPQTGAKTLSSSHRAAERMAPQSNSGPPVANSHAPASAGPQSSSGQQATISRAPASVGPPVIAAPGISPLAQNAPSQLQDFFPWPPPEPSDRQLLALSQLGGDTPAATWGDVADRSIRLLRDAHFPSWGFYAAPGGFAVIPRIEQIDDQSGEALAGNQRWAQPVQLASTNILSGILTVQRPQGLYRVIVFVLTTDPRTGDEVTDPARLLQLARRWGVSGALDLPQAMRGNAITPDQRLFALLYEFESAVGGATKVNSPGRWTLADHLKNAGIVLKP